MTATLLSVGVDWIAGTISNERPDERTALEEWATTLQSDLVRGGDNAFMCELYSYRGVKTSSIFIGNRADSTLVQISGKMARQHYKQIVDLGTRVSRIDLEATVLVSPSRDDVALQSATEAQAYRQASSEKWKIRHINGYGNGDTTYIGSMKSEHYCRLYDKGKESGLAEYDSSWRYEVTYRRIKADHIARKLCTAIAPEALILSTVHNYFQSRGVNPLFPSNAIPPIKTPPEVPSSTEKTLKWIEKKLGPLFNRLIANGYGAELVQALPISELLKYVIITERDTRRARDNVDM